jgi:wyosine [tRNA(Phe)-imidazoG37] synthetase (radical SAM superfamily)
MPAGFRQGYKMPHKGECEIYCIYCQIKFKTAKRLLPCVQNEEKSFGPVKFTVTYSFMLGAMGYMN